MMRILLGMYDERERRSYQEFLSHENEVLISDVSRGLAGLLDDIHRIRPDGVLMDINYPFPNAKNLQSLGKVSSFMLELKYDIAKTLFCVSGHNGLFKRAKGAGYNAFLKKNGFPDIKVL